MTPNGQLPVVYCPGTSSGRARARVDRATLPVAQPDNNETTGTVPQAGGAPPQPSPVCGGPASRLRPHTRASPGVLGRLPIGEPGNTPPGGSGPRRSPGLADGKGRGSTGRGRQHSRGRGRPGRLASTPCSISKQASARSRLSASGTWGLPSRGGASGQLFECLPRTRLCDHARSDRRR
jgi:hypothetical protein